MFTRRSFFNVSIKGILLSLLPVKAVEGLNLVGTTPEKLEPYSVKVMYTSDSPLTLEIINGYAENVDRIKSINQSYANAGRILSSEFTHGDGTFVNTYLFNSEDSYLLWERDIVLSRSVNRKLCSHIVTYEGDAGGLNPQAAGFNKLIVIHVSNEA